jgi:hypothetical protein
MDADLGEVGHNYVKVMDLDLTGISDLDVKIEPADDGHSNGINGIGRPLCEYHVLLLDRILMSCRSSFPQRRQ